MATEPNFIVSLLEGVRATHWGLLGLSLGYLFYLVDRVARGWASLFTAHAEIR